MGVAVERDWEENEDMNDNFGKFWILTFDENNWISYAHTETLAEAQAIAASLAPWRTHIALVLT